MVPKYRYHVTSDVRLLTVGRCETKAQYSGSAKGDLLMTTTARENFVRIAYTKPENELTPKAVRLYATVRRLHSTRLSSVSTKRHQPVTD